MSLQVTTLVRRFEIIKDGKPVVLDDPAQALKAEDVRKFYSTKYPELTNSLIEGPSIVKDMAVYKFVTKAGKLG